MKRARKNKPETSSQVLESFHPRRPVASVRALPHPIHQLLSTLGNRAIGRFVQAKFEASADHSSQADLMEITGPAGGALQETAPAEVALAGGGEPLSEPVRKYFEPRFGHNFGGVRVHTGGAQAAAAAQSINAQAFTLGHDIVIEPGRYNPDTNEGRRLLAHELVHVIQQNGPTDPRSGVKGSGPVPVIARRANGPVIQRAVHEGHDHGGRYEIDDQVCTFTYHQNWFFSFRTSQTLTERQAYMASAQQQIQNVWSNKFPLIPDRENCPCYPQGLSVGVLIHLFLGERRGRGFTIIVTPIEDRGWTSPPIREIELGTAHETPVLTQAPGGQQRIAHEFGHAIGLADEYTDWAGLFHTQASSDTPSIMHNGDEVRPRHYQHFADILTHDLGAACNYSPSGHRLFAYESPPATFTGLPFSFAPRRPEYLIGIAAERRLGNEAWLGLAYPTAGVTAIFNPRERSVLTGPTVGASLNQLAHPLYANVRTGLLFDPQQPGVSLPLSVDLGIRHDRGFQVGINYTAIADLLGRGGWTHLVGLGLEVELP